jgi:hypothetical protein
MEDRYRHLVEWSAERSSNKDNVMVDKITSTQVGAITLRSNFKNVSSGVKVANKDTSDAAVVDTKSGRDQERVSSVVDHLKDAVAYSSKALSALKQVQELSKSSNELKSVSGLTGDLDKLQSDVTEMVGILQDSANTAEVIMENIDSSDARLDDVQAANDHAEDTGVQIRFDRDGAIGAHSNLDPANVASLLKE